MQIENTTPTLQHCGAARECGGGMQIEHTTPTLNNASHTLNLTSLTLYPASFCHLPGAR
jgi:hypothetical protein